MMSAPDAKMRLWKKVTSRREQLKRLRTTCCSSPLTTYAQNNIRRREERGPSIGNIAMTDRGAPPLRPTTPTDLTLVSRQIPCQRSFPIRSFGLGATIDASTIKPDRWEARALNAWWKDFDRASGLCDCDERENCAVLRAIRGSETMIWRDDNVLVSQLTLTDCDQVTRC